MCQVHGWVLNNTWCGREMKKKYPVALLDVPFSEMAPTGKSTTTCAPCSLSYHWHFLIGKCPKGGGSGSEWPLKYFIELFALTGLRKTSWHWIVKLTTQCMALWKKDPSSWEKKEGKPQWEADNDGFLRRGPVPCLWGMGKTLHRSKRGRTWPSLLG